jgi:subfamily B ATP-binding cassette protein MsbA
LSQQSSFSGWQAYKRLLGYARYYWLAFLVSVIGYALYAATQAAFVQAVKYLIEAIERQDASVRTFLPLLVIGIAFARGVGAYLGNYYISYMARNVIHDLRTQLFNHLLGLTSQFYHHHNSGRILAKVTYNVEQVTGAASNALQTLIREGITVIVLIGYLFYLNWQLTLIFLVIIPLITYIVLYVSKKFRKYSNRIQDSIGSVTQIAAEAIKNHEVVRIFAGQDYEKQRFYQASLSNFKQSMKMVAAKSISTPAIQFIIATALAGMMWLALAPSALQSLTTGDFVAFLAAAGFLSKPVRQLSSINSVIQQGIAAAQSIFDLMVEPQEIDQGNDRLNKPVNGLMQVKQLYFRYPQPVASAEKEDKDWVLADINFSIQPGQQVALVGRSGAGKSTLAHLIPRFYDYQQGVILLDNKPVTHYRLSDLRQQIALVNQQVHLFNDTIANNIAYGQLKACSEKAIIAAAEAAYAMEFIDQLPEGIHTLTGENGVLLSGGQRQRLAIARAILKNAPILILDEATSALDTESERMVQLALAHLVKNRTTLVIAHRLSTIEQADQILVLDNGRIVEAGDHKTLLGLSGYYARLHQMQFSDS